jgi:hypothetical protein
MRKLALLVGALMAMSASLAMAQGYRTELSTFGSYTRIKNQGQTTSLSIFDVGYGYYFTPQFVGKIDVTRVSANSFGYTDFALGAKYYFGVGRRSSFITFVDGNYGVEKGTNQQAGSSHHDSRWQLGFGGAYFVTESTSFDVGLHWFRVSTEPYSSSGTIVGMGFTTRF